MPRIPRAPTLPPRLAAALWAALSLTPLLLTGCSHNSQLTLQSLDTHKRYGQHFTEAFATCAQDGEYDVVLVQDGLKDQRPSADPASPLQPSTAAPLRQLVHVHVFWRPEHGAKGDHPSATNCSINWYVLGDTTASSSDQLRYQGAGFAKIYTSKNAVSLTIQNASIKLSNQTGGMVDPIGAATIYGTINARFNAGRVQGLLAEVKAPDMNVAEIPAVESVTNGPEPVAPPSALRSRRAVGLNGPPSRGPMGP